MRIFIAIAFTLIATSAHAKTVQQDAAAIRAKVAKGYSKGAVARTDRAIRIGSPLGRTEWRDLGGNGIDRHMIQDSHGHSLTTDHVADKGYDAIYASRSSGGGKVSVSRQPGVQMSKKDGLTVSDTVSKYDGAKVTTEGSLYREKNLLGRVLHIESTTRYQAKVADGKLVSSKIRSDQRRLVIGGLRIPLPGHGQKTLDKMYEAAK